MLVRKSFYCTCKVTDMMRKKNDPQTPGLAPSVRNRSSGSDGYPSRRSIPSAIAILSAFIPCQMLISQTIAEEFKNVDNE